MENKNLKIALVHDFLIEFGGAERVLEAFAEMFPEAPIYTIIYDREKMGKKFASREIHTSFFQKFPLFLRRRFKYFMFLLPTAPETFDLREFDLVISSSGAWSKGIVTRLNTTHIAYIHSPMRFVWDYNEKYIREERKDKFGFLLRPIFSYFRLWDRLAADRPDHLIANSKYTQDRIKKYYRRESKVIYPPIKLQPTTNNQQLTKNTNQNYEVMSGKLSVRGYFLIVSRLSAYKKIDVAIEAFNKLELPLIIVGTGKEEKYLRKIAGKNIKFLGYVPEQNLPGLYANARAFLFPGIDDFGMAAAEAMSCGTPVIAGRYGGAVEMIEEGKTGEFFEAATPEVLADGVRRFMEREKNYDREYIRQSAVRFNKERFKREIEEFITNVMKSKV